MEEEEELTADDADFADGRRHWWIGRSGARLGVGRQAGRLPYNWRRYNSGISLLRIPAK
jgi:hypothetical protein